MGKLLRGYSSPHNWDGCRFQPLLDVKSKAYIYMMMMMMMMINLCYDVYILELTRSVNLHAALFPR
jgi:hypothetical protein